MGYLVFILLFLLVGYMIYRGRLGTDLSRKLLLAGWGIKVLYSVLFVLVFTYYYGNGELYGDAGNFMKDSKLLQELALNDPGRYAEVLFGIGSNDEQLLSNELADTRIWSYGDNGDLMNDNRLILRINSLIHFFSFANPYVHALIFAFFSFLGSLLLYKVLSSYIHYKNLFFMVICAFPSLAFWTSGITKESIMILGIGLFLYGLIKTKTALRPRNIALLVPGILILLLNKPYMGLIVLSVSTVLVAGWLTQFNRKIMMIWSFLIITSGVLLCYSPGQANLLNKISYKQRDLINIGQGGIFFVNDTAFCAFDFEHLSHFQHLPNDSIKVTESTEGSYKLFGEQEFHSFTQQSGKKVYAHYLTLAPSNSYIHVTPVNYSGWQLIKNIPQALFNTIIRPLPSDPGSSLKYPLFIQNLLLLAWLIYSFFRRKKSDKQTMFWIYYLIACSILTLLIVGWTTPILGAIARYKVGAELFLIIASFIWLNSLKTTKQ